MRNILSSFLIVLFATNAAIAQQWINYTNINLVNSIAIDNLNNIWIGSGNANYSVTKFNGTIWKTNLTYKYVRTLKIDKRGDIWVGTDMQGLYKYNGTNWTQYTTADGLAFDIVCAIAFDSLGNNWIGTADVMGQMQGGVSKFDGIGWKNYTTTDGLVGNLVWSIAIDQKGNKWFGTSKGISMFDGISWTTFDDISYIASNGVGGQYEGRNFYSILIDKHDNKWFGTLGGGVFKYDGTKWTTFPQLDGLGITDIVEDNQENIWFATYKGVFKFDGTTWINYTKADGLLNDGVNSIAIDQYNNKWFATDEGISEFNEDKIVTGINISNDIAIGIYPNPATNFVIVDLGTLPTKSAVLTISDIVGRQMLSKQLSAQKNEIDLQSLSAGTYFYQIDNNRTGKLIKR